MCEVKDICDNRSLVCDECSDILDFFVYIAFALTIVIIKSQIFQNSVFKFRVQNRVIFVIVNLMLQGQSKTLFQKYRRRPLAF